jgi:hypothetical protein
MIESLHDYNIVKEIPLYILKIKEKVHCNKVVKACLREKSHRMVIHYKWNFIFASFHDQVCNPLEKLTLKLW